MPNNIPEPSPLPPLIADATLVNPSAKTLLTVEAVRLQARVDKLERVLGQIRDLTATAELPQIKDLIKKAELP